MSLPNGRIKIAILFFLKLLALSFSSIAQQNLFNIPSGDITPKGNFFYQHQFNFYHNKLESKGHLVYGLGKGWDAGVNLVGKGVYFTPDWRISYNSNPEQGSLYPILLGTLQKQWEINDRIKVNVGGQGGANLSSKLSNKKFNYFTYSTLSYEIKKGSKLVAGPYYGGRMLLGNGNDVGILLGFEAKISKTLYLMGDWISGSNNDAAAVLGGMWCVSQRFQICAGVLCPNPGNPKPNGVVLELNFLGWDYH